MTSTTPSSEEIIRCPSCGAKNRVTAEQREHAPVCGRCKTRLVLSTGPMIVSDATFAQRVVQSPVAVLVDLWAPWCGPCRMIAPTIDALAAEFAGRVRVAKLNVDENPQTARALRADSIPLLVIFKGGRVVDRLVGLMPKEEIAARLEKFA